MQTKINGVLLKAASTVALLAGIGFTTEAHKVAQEALTTDIRNSHFGSAEKDDVLEALEARKAAISESDIRTVPGLIENLDLTIQAVRAKEPLELADEHAGLSNGKMPSGHHRQQPHTQQA